MLRSALKYGLIAGAILTSVIVVPFFFQSFDGLMPAELAAKLRRDELIGYGTMVLAMALVAFAIREHRNQRTGPFGFGKGFAVGASTSAVAALLFGLATVGLYVAMGPERTDEFMRLYITISLGESPEPAALEQAISDYESQQEIWLNPWLQGLVMFLTVLPIGLVVSAIAAWFLRRGGGGEAASATA